MRPGMVLVFTACPAPDLRLPQGLRRAWHPIAMLPSLQPPTPLARNHTQISHGSVLAATGDAEARSAALTFMDWLSEDAPVSSPVRGDLAQGSASRPSKELVQNKFALPIAHLASCLQTDPQRAPGIELRASLCGPRQRVHIVATDVASRLAAAVPWERSRGASDADAAAWRPWAELCGHTGGQVRFVPTGGDLFGNSESEMKGSAGVTGLASLRADSQLQLPASLGLRRAIATAAASCVSDRVSGRTSGRAVSASSGELFPVIIDEVFRAGAGSSST